MQVTTCVVVWIEIPRIVERCSVPPGHHLRGGVDWNVILSSYFRSCRRHHLRGGVDWNLLPAAVCEAGRGHHLRGGVDWNGKWRPIQDNSVQSPPAWWCGLKCRHMRVWIRWPRVTTCVVVWIEIPMPGTAFRSTPSPPAWWCGLKWTKFPT